MADQDLEINSGAKRSTASTIGNYARKVGAAMQPLRDAANRTSSSQSSGGSSGGGYSPQTAISNLRVLGSMKKGGRVKRTGIYRLHKNEHVVPARKASRGARGR